MKRKILLISSIALILFAGLVLSQSCKTIGRSAARYWTNRQIKDFVSKCEGKSAIIIGQENAKKYCDCAVDVVAEKYRNYNDVQKASLSDVLQIAQDCK
ncbi:MAG: hypothetical protein ABIO04_09370 [Ferruginibacter sp.]